MPVSIVFCDLAVVSVDTIETVLSIVPQSHSRLPSPDSARPWCAESCGYSSYVGVRLHRELAQRLIAARDLLARVEVVLDHAVQVRELRVQRLFVRR